MYEIADPCEDWTLKSQTAALVAELNLHCFLLCHICNFAWYKLHLVCVTLTDS